ncbi:MAG: M3 family metallopeptidase [Rikenellaceae bacterium]|nr:M3 family metallopeptidase [Rikenellaceae bacterium]
MKTRLSIALPILLMTLLSACSDKTPAFNPLLAAWDTPFGVPPFKAIKTEHYKPAFDEAMRRHAAEVDSIVSNPAEPDFRNTILALDNSGELLERISNVFFMLASAETDDAMQRVEEEVSPLITRHYDAIMLDGRLFGRVKAVYDRRARLGLDSLQMRLVERTYKDFVRAGAALAPEQQERLRQINEELAVLGVRFGQNLLAANDDFMLELSREELEGLPESVRTAAAQEASRRGVPTRWVFTLSKPSLIPFLTYSDRRDLREKLYKAYLGRCDGGEYDNKPVVKEIVRLRAERARLLGYESHAAFVTDDEMAGPPANAYALLDELWAPALERAQDELGEMRGIRMGETSDSTFEPWDWWYYAEKLRKRRYDLDEEMLRPYFPLDGVRGGAFWLANRLYGVTFRPVAVPLYHDGCQAYEVLDVDNRHLGILYFDFYPRPGKAGGAWCGEFRTQRYDDSVRVAPVVSVVTNFTRPTNYAQAQLSLDEVRTLFHEFGHALHALFADVRYAGLGGVERDFVELPSQIMENWAVEPEMLKRYAFHYSTNEPMPDAYIGKIGRSALFNQGFATTEYLAAAYADLDIHSLADSLPMGVNEFEHEALVLKRGLVPQIEPRYHYPYFSHIFDGGYSAGYYSYIWAEVLDKDAFAAFVETGDIFNRDVARAFREQILSKGGTADGMTLYERFRGHAPSREPLLLSRGLIERPVPDTTAVRPQGGVSYPADSGAAVRPAALPGPDRAPGRSE